jgi:hypothetical protein
MSCPPNSLNGFINLTTVPTSSDLQNIAINTYPFIHQFAPTRGTPLHIYEGTHQISEDLGSSNTILYKGNSYTLNNVQICSPGTSSTAYDIYGIQKPSNASLIFTFLNTTAYGNALQAFHNAVNGSTAIPTISALPLCILLVVPIYGGTESPNSGYLTQLVDSSINSITIPQLLNNQPSMGYAACFNIRISPSDTTAFGLPTNIYSFIGGITISDIHWNSIKSKLPNQSVSPFNFLNNLSVVQYDANNALQPSTLFIPPISVTDERFKNNLQYYILPIASALTSTSPNKNLTPEQYQCFPFDELQNLQDISGSTYVVGLQEAINSKETANHTVGQMVSSKYIISYAIVIGSIIAAFLFVFLIFWGLSYFDPKIPEAAITASLPATAAPSTV